MDQRLQHERDKWKFRGNSRPPFAQQPAAGQESVWDYPRPPAIAPDERRVTVRIGSLVIADSTATKRVLETASPPVFYIPLKDVSASHLHRVSGHASQCEWKGTATYLALNTDPNRPIAWAYASPFEEFAAIKDHVAFYPSRVECYVNGERVKAQKSEFYGGWVTREVVGPFKGEPGTSGW